MRSSLLSLLAGTAALAIAASAAQAADLPSRYAPPPMVAAVPLFTWTGFYVGVNAGYGWNTNDSNTFIDPVFGVVSGGGSDGGFVGGGQIGYNYQFSQFVIGLETDIQYADIGNGRGTFGQGFAGNNNNGNWFGTVRARAGFAFDRALVYATGGLAYGDIGDRSAFIAPDGPVRRQRQQHQHRLGARRRCRIRVHQQPDGEVRRSLREPQSHNNNNFGVFVGNNNSGNTEFGVVRAGLNYKFSSY